MCINIECNDIKDNYIYTLQERQELSKTSLLVKEYFTSTHWNAATIFANINNILPYKETDSISGIEKSKSTFINQCFFISFIIMHFTCFSISASFLKTNTGTDYVNDKKRSVLDSTPAVLLEQFTLFDDNKNNNQESATILKERYQAGKLDLENDVNNYTKTIDHTLFKCGNFTVVKATNIYVFR